MDKIKWFRKLHKVLKEMPPEVEISVRTHYGNVSLIGLHDKGAINRLEQSQDDRMCSLGWGEDELDSFLANNVTANSECI